MRRALWCGIVLASGCGLSVVGTGPGDVNATSTDGGVVIADSSPPPMTDGFAPPVDTDPPDANEPKTDANPPRALEVVAHLRPIVGLRRRTCYDKPTPSFGTCHKNGSQDQITLRERRSSGSSEQPRKAARTSSVALTTPA